MNALNALRSLVRGQVWLPGERGFDAARRPWNLAVDQPVAAVVEAADADDVVALVGHAGFTFLNPHETVADAFAPDVLARLRSIKRRGDPHNVFRSNFPAEG